MDKMVFVNEDDEINFSGIGVQASYNDLINYTASTGEVVEGYLVLQDGIYIWMDFREVEQNEWAFMGYMKIK